MFEKGMVAASGFWVAQRFSAAIKQSTNARGLAPEVDASIQLKSGLLLYFSALSFLRRRARASLSILLNPQLPCSSKRPGEHIFRRGCQPDVGSAIASPASMDGNENFGHFFDKQGLLLGCEHQVSISLLGGGERRKNATSDAKVGRSHM
jgi:hypothetical protein